MSTMALVTAVARSIDHRNAVLELPNVISAKKPGTSQRLVVPRRNRGTADLRPRQGKPHGSHGIRRRIVGIIT